MPNSQRTTSLEIAELFAGVGGFRVGFDAANRKLGSTFLKTVWANQWEPPGTPTRQFAWRCYESHFGEGSCVNEDINKVMDEVESGRRKLPDFQMLVGGFPCQDYSVARPLSQAAGIEGKKGVLWWDIYRMLSLKKPRHVLLENVDRLLKSPGAQRGRDFAIILSCFSRLGYAAEWRVINAGDFGMPQRRRRTYIYARLNGAMPDLATVVSEDGILAKAFPMTTEGKPSEGFVTENPYEVSSTFGVGKKVSPFLTAGAMCNGQFYSTKATALFDGRRRHLGDVLVPDEEVPEQYFIEPDTLDRWKYLKGAKREKRTSKSGFTYNYSEGAMAFPDSLDKPSRTILTGEGGRGASRFKHVVLATDGRYRRLVPDELDQLQCFPKGWTNTGMSDHQRAFCMGNALVTEIPQRIGIVLAQELLGKK